MDYERNAKYFKPAPSPKPIVILAIIGVILLACKVFLWGLGAIILAVIIGVVKYSGRPTDAEIDEQFNSMFVGLKEQALNKLGLDEEEIKTAPPLFLGSYSFGKTRLGDRANNETIDKKGSDGYWRSPEIVLTAWFFTEDMLYHYVKIASLVSDAKKETTDEIFYQDVVSVKTGTLDREATRPDGSTARYTETAFILRNTGGEVIEDACNNSEQAENAVRAMRSLLKQKKLV